MNRTADRVSGVEKASILLKSLGSETAAKVFEYLSVDEREVLTAHMVSLKPVSSVTRRSVIDEVTKHVREAHKQRDAKSTVKGKPLAWMEEMDPASIAAAFAQERPQSAAMVLSLLSPLCSANILAELDDKTKNQIIIRLSTMKPVSDRALLAIDEAMREKFLNKGNIAPNPQASSKTLARIIGSAANDIKAGITSPKQPAPAPSIVKSISQYTSPEQMLELTDAEMYEVLTRVRIDDLIAILRVASEDLKGKVVRNVSPDSAKIIRKGLASPSKTTLRELEESNERVLNALSQWSAAFNTPLKAA